MTLDDIEKKRARLVRLVADLKDELEEAKAALAALPKANRGRKKGHKVHGEKGVTADHNHSATRRVLSLIQRHEIAQRKFRRSLKVPKLKMEEFISTACAAFPKAKAERVRTLVNINRKSGEDKEFSRGPIKRLIVDFDA
jgi:hypothetical protein